MVSYCIIIASLHYQNVYQWSLLPDATCSLKRNSIMYHQKTRRQRQSAESRTRGSNILKQRTSSEDQYQSYSINIWFIVKLWMQVILCFKNLHISGQETCHITHITPHEHYEKFLANPNPRSSKINCDVMWKVRDLLESFYITILWGWVPVNIQTASGVYQGWIQSWNGSWLTSGHC